MHLSANHSASNLPKSFPIGTTYVVEGRGGEAGQLQVYSRYLVLPGGQRINLVDDASLKAAGPASARKRRSSRARGGSPNGRKMPSIGAKKISAAAGTPRQGRR